MRTRCAAQRASEDASSPQAALCDGFRSVTDTGARQMGKVQTLVRIAGLIRQRRQALTGQPTQFPSCRVESITHCPWTLHEGDHSLIRYSEPGRSCTGEQMTATEPFYLSVPGDHFLLFRSCSQAITTEPWRPGDLLIWRRALCLNALVTPAFCSFCVHNHIRRRQLRQMRKVFF